ncbi:MAG: TIGR04053 family radical SAM/SPASM domain-containing protein [Desulfurococcales archaeon]|nr:TIGR04053 family radical SAM/SPASM domain-containing protein [Desulfurococcales archaeon]
MKPGHWPFDKKPLLVFWETTKACMLACKHCRAEAILKPLPGELSTQEALRLLEDIAMFGKPTPIVVYTGGDPLMRRDIWDILAYARKLGIRSAMAPSVTPLLTRDVAYRLAEYGVSSVSLSLDSPWPAVHDEIRGIAGTWRKTLEAIEWFRSAGLRVQINTVVMRDTVEGLADMVKLLLDKGIRTWEVFYLVPVGRAGKALDLTPQEWEDVSHFLYEASRYGILIRTTEGPIFRRVALIRAYYEEKGRLEELDSRLGPLYHRLIGRLRDLLGEAKGKPKAHTLGTMDGRGIIFVSYNGNVYPSGFLPIPAGNVRTRSIVDIYRNSLLFNRLRSSVKGKCGVCEFRELCGGSRARAYAYTGDPLAEDPSCIYQPGSIPEELARRVKRITAPSRGVEGA